MIEQVMRRLHLTPDANFFNLLQLVALITTATGYLLTVESSQQLSLGPFVLFTVINLTWVILLTYLFREDCGPTTTRFLLGALAALAAAAILCMPLGLGYDWMIAAVTTAIVAMSLTWRWAIATTMFFLVASTVALLLAHNNLGEIVSALAGVLMAFIFMIIFSLVIRHQLELREQAEELAMAVSRANAELARAHAELRAHASEAEELTISRERNRLAREIHDTLGHYLTILAVQLETALKLEERDDPRLETTLRGARRVTAECLAEVRRSVAALRPGDVAGRSLGDALRRLANETETLSPEMEVTLDMEDPEPELEPELRAAFYRCAQEALTNVRKHARATKALVRLRVGATDSQRQAAGREIELTVLDNGQGVSAPSLPGDSPACAAPGFGLQGMRERIALLGGTAQAGAEPDQGWRVVVRAPLIAVTGNERQGATSPGAMPNHSGATASA